MGYAQHNYGDDSPVEPRRNIPFIFILQGGFIALCLSVVFILVAGAIINWIGVSEQYSPTMIFISSAGGILLGARWTGKRAGSRGWFNGGMVGVLYIVATILLGLVVLDDFFADIILVSRVFFGLSFGVIGGMWGVNS